MKLENSCYSRLGEAVETPTKIAIGQAVETLYYHLGHPLRLVEFYLGEIQRLNLVLKGVIEVNPDAVYQANKADRERKACSLSGLHGIPVLLKDNIGTKDKLNTTIGSLALLGSVVPRDACGVVAKLRKAGAVVLGKASLSECTNFRSLNAPNGWSARGDGQESLCTCYRQILVDQVVVQQSVVANLVAVALGTETDNSILCPASFNSVVGIKPTIGLTSQEGVILNSSRQDTIGPIGRIVSDVVYVLDAIVGFDYYDEATRDASKYILRGGYNQFLKACRLKGKRLGIVRNPFFISSSFSGQVKGFENHFQTLRQGGAMLIDHLEIANIDVILNATLTGEATTLLAEFKLSLNAYLKDLVVSPVRTLADVIFFNEKFSDLEMIKEFGQYIFLAAQITNGIGNKEKEVLLNVAKLSRDGFEKVMRDNRLDALVTPNADFAPILAGYDSEGVPFGISFGGLRALAMT